MCGNDFINIIIIIIIIIIIFVIIIIALDHMSTTQ